MMFGRTKTLVGVGGCVVIASVAMTLGCSDFDAPEESVATVQEAVTVSFPSVSDATIVAAGLKGEGLKDTCNFRGDQVVSQVGSSCLLRFDLSSIPASAIVTSAQIRFEVLDQSTQAYNLHRMRVSWHEPSTTWQFRSQTSPVNPSRWQMPGAKGANDRDPSFQTFTPSAVGPVALTLGAAGRSVVQNWVNGSGPNHGIIIAHDTRTDLGSVASRQHVNAGFRPVMTVTYSIP